MAKMFKCLCLAVFIIGISTQIILSINIPDVARIEKEELVKLLDNPDVIILDVRVQNDWSLSAFKIKGAVRLDNADALVKVTYPMDKTLILYCA